MEKVIYFILWITILDVSEQIYVPDESYQKPVTYTPEIEISGYRKPVQVHHNYSKVYRQNGYSSNYQSAKTSHNVHPVYNPFSERLTQTYVLNGTKIRTNANPTRQIVIYNKEKRTPKTQIYKTCPEGVTGQLVYETSCHQFLNCWRGRGYVQNCAPGTLFNPKTLECDFPEKVTCISGPRESVLQLERSYRSFKQVGCPKEFSGLIPNYTDCSRFINCVGGIENLMECPSGTLFDINKNVCDFAHKASCFNGENQNLVERNIDGKLDFSQKYRNQDHQQLRYEVKCPSGTTGLHPHPTDCSKFLNCGSGETHVQNCGPGTLFNPNLKICDFPYNVRCEKSTFGSGVIDYDATNQSIVHHHDSPEGGSYKSSTPYGMYQYQGNYFSRPYSTSPSPYITSYHNGGAVQGSRNPYGVNQYHGGGLDRDYSRGTTGQHNGNQGTPIYPSKNRHGQQPYHDPQTYGNGYNQNHYSRGTVDQEGTQLFSSGGTYDRNHGTKPHGTHDHGSSYDRNYNQGSVNQDTNLYGSNTYDHGTTYDRGYNRGSVNQGTNLYNPYDHGSTNYNHNKGSSNQGFNPYDSSSIPYDRNQGTRYSSSSPYDRNQGSINHGTSLYGTNAYDQGFSYDRTHNPESVNHGTNPYGTHYSSSNSYDQGPSPTTPRIPIYSPITPYDQRPTLSGSVIPNNQNHRLDTTHSGTGTTYSDPFGSGTEIHDFRTPFNQHPREPNQNFGTQRPQYGSNQGSNPYHGSTYWGVKNNQRGTPNYDQVVNIDQVRSTTPYRNQFYGTTSKPRVSISSDYDDHYSPSHGPKYIRSTTPKLLEKVWPPPFPSTDVNADYVFDYDDEGVTLEAENSIIDRNSCQKNEYSCDEKCIPKNLVCNGVKDCPDGKDEHNCLESLSRFSVQKNKKLAILEKERWNNVSIAACASLCVQTNKLRCRSFNYRKIDKTCFLTDTNEGLTGGLISYYLFDYYELITEKINCSHMFVCSNKKCIDKKKICDGHDDCGDRMDEKGCRPQDFGYSVRLTGSEKHNEGLIQVSAFGKTGYVCDDNFGMRDANIVCKELGFPLGAAEVKKNSFYGSNGSNENTFYMMDDVGCLGNETRLLDCDFSGWGVHNCGGQEAAGVVCKTSTSTCASDYWKCDSGRECLPLAFVCDGLYDCTDNSDEGSQHCDAPTQIRLVNGSSLREGRIEIRHHGTWGTICDDDFNEDAAKVVCRNLGYKGAAIVKKDAYFGRGTGPIWLDQVFCSGNESSVEECSHWNWGEHNCDHGEDVGIICSNMNEYAEYIERHQMGVQPVIPKRYPERCGYRNDNIFNLNDDVHFRVVKASIAQKGHYPWQAAIRIKGKTSTSHWCGAVIIHEKFVVTAAHCLVGYSKGAYVIVAGDYNTDEDEGTEQEARIEDYYLHEDFKKGHKMNNDIALVKLKGYGFELNGDVQAICLPDSDTSYEGRRNCTISGFGSIESGKSAFSHNLRAGWVPLQKKEICTMPHVYGDALTDGMFCAGSLDEGVDSCDGDSGGPLACLDRGVFTLYGITSWGQHCGYANKPGVYVKVAHYRKWIDDHFKKHSVENS